jgi:hypothetical protein
LRSKCDSTGRSERKAILAKEWLFWFIYFLYLFMATYIVNPTEQEKALNAFLNALEVSFVKDDDEELPPHVLAGIARGREDIKAGRYKTFEEIKKKYPVK